MSEPHIPTASTAPADLPSSRRIHRIDWLRGIFLVLMFVNHLPEQPFRRLSFQPLGFASGAEGFVFVSGVTIGLVYGAVFLRNGLRALVDRCYHRAAKIYCVQVALVSGLVLLAVAGVAHFSLMRDSWEEYLLRAAVFQHQPQYHDILPLYVVFLLVAPLFLWCFHHGYTVPAMTLSLGTWWSAQPGIGLSATFPLWAPESTFNILAWQLLFVAGLYCGLAYRKGTLLLPTSKGWMWGAISVAAILFLLRHNVMGWAGSMGWGDENLVCYAWKKIVHPIRLIDCAAIAYCLWRIPATLDGWLPRSPLNRALILTGRNSLPVFAFAIVVAGVVKWIVLDAWLALGRGSKAVAIVCMVAGLPLAALLTERAQSREWQWAAFRRQQTS
jgi:hypothetical protein